MQSAKQKPKHRIIYIMLNALCVDGRLEVERWVCLPLSAIYDLVQIAADASSDAFTARSAVRALVAS